MHAEEEEKGEIQ